MIGVSWFTSKSSDVFRTLAVLLTLPLDMPLGTGGARTWI